MNLWKWSQSSLKLEATVSLGVVEVVSLIIVAVLTKIGSDCYQSIVDWAVYVLIVAVLTKIGSDCYHKKRTKHLLG